MLCFPIPQILAHRKHTILLLLQLLCNQKRGLDFNGKKNIGSHRTDHDLDQIDQIDHETDHETDHDLDQ